MSRHDIFSLGSIIYVKTENTFAEGLTMKYDLVMEGP